MNVLGAMAIEFKEQPFAAGPVTAEEDQSVSSPSGQSINNTRNNNHALKLINEIPNRKKAAANSQEFESRLADIVNSDDWDQLIKSDATRSSLLSQMRLQMQSSLGALAYTHDLDHNDANVRIARDEQSPYHWNHGSEAQMDVRSSDSIISPRTHRGSEPNREWKLEVKRWKRVAGRTGSTDFYDENEKIEDIRRREREIRGGGYVLNVYDMYEIDGKDCQTHLEISSAPLLVRSTS